MIGWVRGLVAEAWALIIDDLGLAVGALAAAAIAALALRSAGPVAAGLVLFLGLAASLLISVWRRARRRD